MRLYKVVILANFTFGLGLLDGYLWWQRDVTRLRQELETARQSAPARLDGEARGIVRAVLPREGLVVITHEPLCGLMGSMTMAFRVRDRALMNGIEPGDQVRFTLMAADKDLVLVALRKEGSP